MNVMFSARNDKRINPNELQIMWHRWQMERAWASDKDLCRHHAEQMVLLIKARQ